MLFDLGDYENSGFIGPMSGTMSIGELNWVDPLSTHKATRDAYYKSVSEYFFKSIAVTPLRRREALYNAASKFESLKDELAQKAILFWGAMLSQANGISSQEDFESLYSESIRNYDGELFLTYTVFTPEIYNQYIRALGALISALANFLTVADDTNF